MLYQEIRDVLAEEYSLDVKYKQFLSICRRIRLSRETKPPIQQPKAINHELPNPYTVIEELRKSKPTKFMGQSRRVSVEEK